MNVVDSSGWIEYFTGGPGASFYAEALENVEELVVPSISILEVFKFILRKSGEGAALEAIAAMRQGTVVDLDGEIALLAGKWGVERSLPLADSVIYATARSTGATVWTQDGDFRELPNVRYVEPKR